MVSRQTKQEKLETTMSDAYTDHAKALNKHSFFKVHNLELSEDLVQETFTKTWGYMVKGGKIELMRAFLYHTLNCLIIDEYRKRKAVSLEILVEKGFEPSKNDTEALIEALDGKAATLLLKQLPQKYQDILRMRFTQGLSLTEMAEHTGQTKNAMAVQVHRGLQKLRVLYNHD